MLFSLNLLKTARKVKFKVNFMVFAFQFVVLIVIFTLLLFCLLFIWPFLSGFHKEVHQCCLTATFTMEMLIEHARTWGASEINNTHFTELSSQFLDTVKRLAGHVIDIIEVGVVLFSALAVHVLLPNLVKCFSWQYFTSSVHNARREF